MEHFVQISAKLTEARIALFPEQHQFDFGKGSQLYCSIEN